MTGADEIGAPEHLAPAHDVATFDSGVPLLDDWLKRRALANERAGASRTYVVAADGRVVGYYALATGAIAVAGAPGRVRRNMPDPVPVTAIGRLAVDRAYHGRGIGQGLLKDAVPGIRAVLVNATSEDAKRFYQRHGFMESPVAPLTLMITLADAELAITRPRE